MDGATEDAGTGVELDEGFPIHHLRDPVNPLAAGGLSLHGRLHLGGDLGGVRSSGAEHNLKARIHVADGFNEVDDALLAGDTPDEENIRLRRIDAKAGEGGGKGQPFDTLRYPRRCR